MLFCRHMNYLCPYTNDYTAKLPSQNCGGVLTLSSATEADFCHRARKQKNASNNRTSTFSTLDHIGEYFLLFYSAMSCLLLMHSHLRFLANENKERNIGINKHAVHNKHILLSHLGENVLLLAEIFSRIYPVVERGVHFLAEANLFKLFQTCVCNIELMKLKKVEDTK